VYFLEAHNDYLQILAEGGLLVGLPVLVAVLIFAGDVQRRFKEAPKTGLTYWLRVGAVVGLVSVAVQSLVEFSLQMPGNAVTFVVLVAIALHRPVHATPQRPVLYKS
jgi:O-antigen ligase